MCCCSMSETSTALHKQNRQSIKTTPVIKFAALDAIKLGGLKKVNPSPACTNTPTDFTSRFLGFVLLVLFLSSFREIGWHFCWKNWADLCRYPMMESAGILRSCRLDKIASDPILCVIFLWGFLLLFLAQVWG